MKPNKISTAPSEYVEEFVVASITSLIATLALIDIVLLNMLANRNQAPYRLIKTGAENEKKIKHSIKTKHSEHSDHGHKILNKSNHSINSTSQNQRLKEKPTKQQ